MNTLVGAVAELGDGVVVCVFSYFGGGAMKFRSRYFTAARYLLLCIVLASFAAVGRPAMAREILGLTGLDVATDGDIYGYVGAIIPLNESGKVGAGGWILRLWGSGQSFDYKRSGIRTVTATGGSGEILIGRSLIARGDTWFNVYLGYVFRAFDTDPKDRRASVNRHHGLKFQGEFVTDIGNDWGIDVNAQFTAIHNVYWTRLRTYFRVTETIKVGPELSPSGGSHWDTIRVGAFVAGIPVGKARLGIKAGGARAVRHKSWAGYFGVSASFLF